MTKVSEEIRRDLLQGAIHDPKKVRVNERTILTECIIVFVRVIRNPKAYGPQVLPAALRGLASHAIHVNNEMLAELMEELSKLAKKDSGVDAESRLSALDGWLRLSRMAQANVRDKTDTTQLLLPDPSTVSESLVNLIQEGSLHLSCGEYISKGDLENLLANQQAQMSTYALHQYVSQHAATLVKSFPNLNIPLNAQSESVRPDFLRRLCGCVEATSEVLAAKMGESHSLAVGRIVESLLGVAVLCDSGIAEEILALTMKVLRRHPRTQSILEKDGLIISPLVPPMTVLPVLGLLLSHVSHEVRTAAKRLLELPESQNKAPSAGGVMGSKWTGVGLKRSAWDLDWLLTRESEGVQANILKDILKFKDENENDDDEEEYQDPDTKEWSWMFEVDEENEKEVDEDADMSNASESEDDEELSE
eukprot:GDKJ01052180.1.p1 GENE.GDKJ01052180.1~~GDKJ01052180.1.p1  ORF type:complete len:429 (-),score=120.66 GDKJ01052180.1:133-1392(-)